MSDLLDEVMAGLARAPGYRRLAPSCLRRAAGWGARRHARPPQALKAAKRKLHQGFGAYLATGAHDAIARRLDSLDETSRPEALRRAALDILALHRSSAERLDSLEGFYGAVLDRAGRPESIVDLAAGLNAFALPFAGLAPGTRYVAVDADRGLVEASRRFMALLPWPGEAIWADIMDGLPRCEAQLALVLKALPCLERQRRGAALGLLERLSAVPRIVVSYPTRSLGGRAKGMAATYRAQTAILAGRIGRPLCEIAVPNELVMLLGPPRR